MNDDLNPTQEQAMDALLAETLGSAEPPDLSHEIFEQLRVTPSELATIVCTDDRISKRETRSSAKKQVTVFVAVGAALAASLMFAIWLRSDHRLEKSSLAASSSESDWPEFSFPMDDPTRPPLDASKPKRERKPKHGIPLVIGSKIGDEPGAANDAVNMTSPTMQPPLDAVTLVSKQVDSELRNYWDAVGIEPSGDASGDAIVGRLSMALGIKLPADSVDNPQQLEIEVARPKAARAIASRWLQQITERGLLRVDQKAMNGLISDLAGCFQSKRQFDLMLASWIGGQSLNTSAFYAAVSSGSKGFPNSGVMVRRVGALTMNVDLRCTRCHDSHIVGNGRQQDYWAFAEFLRRGLTRGADGTVTIDVSSDSSKPLFYALPDGRQRIAEPAVAATWMKSQAEQPVSSVREWSEKLIGSPELARGVVNSLWQLVHGQPLCGRVVDPISAPHNDSLDRLEENLAQDLIRSEFNVARTLALIIASPVTQRSVPTSLLPENALVAGEPETRAAMNAVDAFAAALPPHAELPMRARLDETMRAIGAKLNADGQPFFAQIGNATDNPGNAKASQTTLSVDFPYRAGSLPVQWLRLIKNEQSQVEHLGYLAGVSQLPSGVLESAEAMRAANVSTELTLQRVWWMLRP